MLEQTMGATDYSQKHLDRGPVDLEDRITRRIDGLVTTELGKVRLSKMRELQLSFFVKACRRVYENRGRENTSADFVHLTEELMAATDFVGDERKLNVDLSRGLVVATGHFGIGKAMKISKEALVREIKNLGVTDDNWLNKVHTAPNDEPFPIRSAAILKSVFNICGTDRTALHELIMWYPFPFDEIEKDCGVVGVYLDKSGQYDLMRDELNKKCAVEIEKGKIPVVLMYPEGGTTGKRTESGNPYELGKFRTGFLAYAMDSEIPILPIVQVVGKDAEFRTKILEPVMVTKNSKKDELIVLANEVRTEMQTETDKLLEKL